MAELDLRDANLLGHSAGCSLIWCLFGPDRVARHLLVDEPPVVANPGWTDEERWAAGGMMEPNDLYCFADRLAGPDGEAATREMIFPW